MSRILFVMSVLLCSANSLLIGQEQADSVPSAAAIEELLKREPLSEESWPIWRQRYLAWYYDRLGRTESFNNAMGEFVVKQVRSNGGEMPVTWQEDVAAWCCLGRGLIEVHAESPESLVRAEEAFRRAIELAPSLGGAHSGLAIVLIAQAQLLPDSGVGRSDEELLQEAEQEVQRAEEVDARTRPASLRGAIAYARKQFSEAEKLFATAMQDYPTSETCAIMYVRAVMAQKNRKTPRSEATVPLVKKFSEAGELHILHAAALSYDEEFAEAVVHLDRAIELGENPDQVLGPNAAAQLREAARLTSRSYILGIEAFEEQRFDAAEYYFRQALLERPGNVEYALAIANSRLSQLRGGPDRNGEAVGVIRPLVKQFPNSGELRAFLAVALAAAARYSEATKAIEQAEALGANPTKQLGQDVVDRIYELSRPSLPARILYGAANFAAVYAVVMLAMAAGGALLALLTQGHPTRLPRVINGRVELTGRERLLTRLYICALMVSLALFYVAVPFVSAGVALATLGFLYCILIMPVISIYLLAFVGTIGFGIVIAVFKSLFAKPEAGAFGVRKNESDCPRLFECVKSVAHAVGTDFIDVVFVGPGSSIGVHQEGRGPFGMLGIKRRVLTLGLGVLHDLPVCEFKAILAHEYAHFSHQDTAYSRLIHQVTMSIHESLHVMGYTLGSWNWVNPFFWFFYLYYKSYSMLAAGFSRSREYLADRMAASLYGKNSFTSGLRRVATDGQFFEGTIHQHVAALLDQGRAFANMYEAFREYRHEQVDEVKLGELYQAMLNEKPSLFSTHPTFNERVAAIADMPDIEQSEHEPAHELFDDVEEIEKELTEYLTGYHHHIRQMALQAQS